MRTCDTPHLAHPLIPRTVSYLPSGHPVSILIREATRRHLNPLRTAYEAGKWTRVLSIIEAECVKVDGCWLWSRRHGKGYGKIRLGGRDLMPHRLVAQAVRKGDLDPRMPVHHTCAEGLCCNPSHLQVVTPQENTAEMLERRYYVARIAELEAELEELNGRRISQTI